MSCLALSRKVHVIKLTCSSPASLMCASGEQTHRFKPPVQHASCATMQIFVTKQFLQFIFMGGRCFVLRTTPCKAAYFFRLCARQLTDKRGPLGRRDRLQPPCKNFTDSNRNPRLYKGERDSAVR